VSVNASSNQAAKENAPARKKRLSPWDQREYDALPDKINAAEGELTALDARLSDPALYTAPRAEQDKVHARRVELQAQIESLYARWSELEG
jgi:ATP-binding cassette subfamily F protein uup